MNIFNTVRSECVLAQAQTSGKEELLRLIAATAKKSPLLSEVTETKITEALKYREGLGSTGFGHGVAIPHCRLPEVKDFVVGIISLADGVDFDAVDGAKVKVIMFIVAPDVQSNDHIRLLSNISRVVTVPGVTEEMLSARDSDTLKECFLRHLRDETVSTEDAKKSLFHVFIQDENLFRDILQVFSNLETSSTVVLAAENTSAYLSKLPLFAGFWTDTPDTFSRVILAVVSRKMTNELTRQIDEIAGGLSECKKVLITVQEIFYTAGQLDI